MAFKNTIKRFFQEVNKKLVARNPLSYVYPFNKVKKPSGPPHIRDIKEEEEVNQPDK